MPPELDGATQDGAPVEDDAEKMFAEEVARRQGTEPPDLDAGEATPEANTETVSSEEHPASQDEPEQEAAAPEQSDGPPQDDAAGDKPAVEPADIWANSSPEQLRELERLRKAERDGRGRQSSLQRKVNDLQRQIRNDNARKAAAPRTDAATADTGADDTKAPSASDNDELKELAEEYPELAKPFMSVIDKQNAQIQSLAGRVEGVALDAEQQRAESFARQQASLLKEAHPDWEKLSEDPNFQYWVFNQAAPKLQEAARENSELLQSAEDMKALFNAYKEAQGLSSGQPAPAADTAKTNQIAARREHQLRSSQSVENKGPGQPANTPDDIEALFEAEVARQTKRRAS